MICIKTLNKRLPTAQGNALWVHNVLAAIKGDRWKTKIVAIHRETLPKAVFFSEHYASACLSISNLYWWNCSSQQERILGT